MTINIALVIWFTVINSTYNAIISGVKVWYMAMLYSLTTYSQCVCEAERKE